MTIPKDWESPWGLELFCSDDYQVREDQKPSDGWMAYHAYPGHCVKQILVDGETVWEADAGWGGPLGVDLTEHVQIRAAF